MKVITLLGSVEFLAGVVILMGLILAWGRHWKDVCFVVGSGLFTLLLRTVLKEIFHRPRPELWPTTPDGYSFPSGHALGSVIIYGLLLYLLGRVHPRWRPALWTFYLGLVIAIGLSRLYLGMHWPTDVLGGWVIGAVILLLLIKGYEGGLWSRLRRRHQRG